MMSQPSHLTTPLLVRDFYGRRYRTGVSDRDLLGRSRRWMFWLAVVPMMAVGVLQYGYAGIVPILVRTHGWSLSEAFWLLAVWTVFQAGTGFPIAWLRDRRQFASSSAMFAGAVLCCAGLVVLGNTSNLAVALVGYSVCGGVGAGLVYATCIGTAARWYPERSTAIVGLVGGAFAFGAVPFLLLAYTVVDVADHAMLLDGAGIVALVVVAACGALLRDPPAHWWPAHIDPRVWALDKRVNRGLAKNRPALRRYSPGEVVHNRTFAAMCGLLALAAAVSLFDLVYLAVLAAGNGLSRTAVATAFGLLVGANGGGRAVIAWLSDRVVRSRALAAALIVGGLAQFGLLFGGQHGSSVLVIVAAGLAGLGTGCCFPLLVAIVREYFGEDAALQNFGIAYSAKAIGSLAGTGLAAVAVSMHGHAVTLFTVAVLGLAGSVVARLLHQPGRPPMLLPGVGTRHGGARSREAATVFGYGRVDVWDV